MIAETYSDRNFHRSRPFSGTGKGAGMQATSFPTAPLHLNTAVKPLLPEYFYNPVLEVWKMPDGSVPTAIENALWIARGF